MKKYIFYNSFVLAIVIYYLFSSGFIAKVFKSGEKEETVSFQSPSRVQYGSYPKEFINCIFNMKYYGRVGSTCYSDHLLSVENNLSKYKGELNFNSLHIYSGAGAYNNGYSCGGSFFDPFDNDYKQYFNGLSGSVSNAGIKGIYGRAKVEMPCYFQRVEYEIKNPSNPNIVNYGFCYEENHGSYEVENGRTVLYIPSGQERLICQNIYENKQHSDFFDWQLNDAVYWRIYPMMRIDSNYVDQYPDENVVRIEIIKYNGQQLKSVDIKARDFARNNNYTNLIYGGQYIDSINFYFEQAQGINLLFSGSKDASGLNDGRYVTNSTNNVDFRVYTYGNTDVWFDKLTVQDLWAEQLFHGDFDNRISQEVNEFANNGMFSFFADELPFSCLRSAKYVKDIIETNPNGRFYFAISNYFSIVGLKNPTVYFDAVKDIVNPKCFCMDAHEVFGKVPQAFNNITSMNLDPLWKSDNYEDYNLFVQNRVLGDKNSICPSNNVWPYNFHQASPYGSLIYQVCLARTTAEQCTPRSYLFVQPQIQSNMVRYTDGICDWNREPTNEEIRVQACCALAHGADGLSWFTYQSFSCLYPSLNSDAAYLYKEYDSPPKTIDSLIVAGMLEMNGPGKRYLNYYNQNKWQFVGDMNQVFLNWKPTLDNINWLAGYSTHSEGSNHYYINNILSVHRDPELRFILNENCTNCDETKYWEMGFFEPLVAGDNSKYLLMVNRRCSPEVEGGDGDLRSLQIKFNPDQLPGANSWTIQDVNTGETVSFDKNCGTFVYLDNLGLYQPGEGKLYRLAPTTIIGGNLACDENIQGGTFTLQDTLYTNGYNLTIGFGTTINFTDSACIVVNGGSFTCGDVSQPTHERNIIFKGVTGNTWSGLQFNNCDLVNINSAQFQNIKGPAENTNYAVKLINCNTFNINNCTFTNSDPQKSGAIEANFSGDATIGNGSFYIAGNTFNMNTSDKVIVSVIANADCNVPVMVDNNIFTSTSNSATAMYLSFVSGVEIGGNAIVGFNKGIEMHYTNIDVIGNTITSTTGNNGAKGIDAQDFSSANLSTNGTLRNILH